MEKFAVDLDKLLDDLESDDAPCVGRVGKAEAAGGGAQKPDVRPLADVDSFTELIDLSDADFGLGRVLKPSPVVTQKPHVHLTAAPLLPTGSSSGGGSFVASAAKTSAESTKAAWEVSLDIFSTTGSLALGSSSSSDSNGGSSSVPYHNNGWNGSWEPGVRAATAVLPRWPSAAASAASGHPMDGRWNGSVQRVPPSEFNPLDSEPHFLCSPPPYASLPAAGSFAPGRLAELLGDGMSRVSRPPAAVTNDDIGEVYLWQPVAAEAGGGGGGGAGGASVGVPFVTWEETAKGSRAERDGQTGRFDHCLPGDDDADAMPVFNEANSLLIANGVVHAARSQPLAPSSPDLPAFAAGICRPTSGSAAAAAAAAAAEAAPGGAPQQDGSAALSAARSSALLSSSLATDSCRPDVDACFGGGGVLLRFEDIIVGEHDDDDASMDAYLAGVPLAAAEAIQQQQQHQQQPPGLGRNALLEANYVSNGRMRSIGDLDSDEEEHVALPTLQENALLQANLVAGVTVAATAARDDSQLGRLSAVGGGGCGKEADGLASPGLGDSLGVSRTVPLENGYGWPPVTADQRHLSGGSRASTGVAMAAPAGGAAQPDSLQLAVALAAQPAAVGPVKRAGAPGSEMTGPVEAASHATIAVAGNGSTKETRRPNSLLGLSKVALESAAAAGSAAPCNDLAADSRLTPSAAGRSREGEGLALAGSAASSTGAGGGHVPSAVVDLAAASSSEPASSAGGDSSLDAASPSGTREQGEGQEALPGEPTAFANGADYGEPAGGNLLALRRAADVDTSLAGLGGRAEDMAGVWDDLGATKPIWLPDSEAPDCMACNTKFTFTKRRHHCRACGLVFCASCCNMKSRLLYLDFKEARVCSKCHDQLAIGELRQRELLGQQVNGGTDSLASAGLESAAAAAEAASQAGQPFAAADDTATADAAGAATLAAIPPAGVLRRTGSRSGQSKTVMFSDGIRPGGDLTHLDGTSVDPAAAAAAAAAAATASVPGGAMQPSHGPPARSKKKRSSIGDLIKPRTAFIIPKTGLPPVLYFTDKHSREYIIDENPNSDLLYETMKDQSGESSFAFAIHKDLHIYVKLVQLNCCAKKLCWCVTSKGLCTVGQEEVVVVLECAPDERDFPADLFYFYRMLYEQTFKGVGAMELSFATCTKETLRRPGDGFLGSKEHGGFLFVRPTFQCLQGLPLPPAPYLVAVLLDKWELPWAKALPLRLALRLGAEYRYYPCPLVSIRGRKPVYGEIGHTIMNLLADFRNYQYTLGRVDGVTVHLQDKVTVISFPKNKYNEIYKILSSSNDYVLALGASFSSDADSHLVCVQTDEGVYQTQAINIQDKPRKVTGASFVVFSGALKTSAPGVIAKSSIVEDGLMVQILPEAMLDLKNKIKNMQDHSIKCGVAQQQGPAADGTEEAVYIKWVDEYKKYNVGVTSPIDGFPLDGVDSLHVYGYSDLAGSGRRSIRWTEVFFLQNDEPGNSPADPVDLSRLAETVAGSCMAAMSPHLETLKDSGMIKIGLRVTLGADQVGYEIGSNGHKLPTHILNDLDNELVPVVHSTASSLSSGSLTVLELVFHVLE